jgi:5,5'-dehydrodivanillate O-demethylase
MTPEENKLLTEVGLGTPCGALLRHYWWPVSFSERLGATPQEVRILGEDLVLYRQGEKAALIGRTCAHRGASLALGRAEADGLRCCYHGWKFNAEGQCVDMPAEPRDSPMRNEVRVPAYPTFEVGGLIFAYLGEAPAPAFPRYDLLFEPGLHRVVHATFDHCNWLQRAENSVDQLHATVLHAAGYPELALKRTKVDWTRTPYGIRAQYDVDGQGKVSHFVFPSSNRYFGARVGEGSSHNFHIRVPRDDESTITYGVRAYRAADGNTGVTTRGLSDKPRGVYARVDDGWWGIASNEQDRAAQESQGIIADRSREILGTSDAGVVMFRRMLRDAIAAVARGEDPPGVVRHNAERMIRFDASQTRDGDRLSA